MIFIIKAGTLDTFYIYKESRWLHKAGMWIDERSFMSCIKNLQYNSRREAIQKLKEVEGKNVRFAG